MVIGWLSHALTTRALRSEQLAQQQAAELALLDRINALAVENSPEGLLALTGNGLVRHIIGLAMEGKKSCWWTLTHRAA